MTLARSGPTRMKFFQSNPEIFTSNKQLIESGKANEFTPPVKHCQYCGAEIITWAFGWQGDLVWRPEPERCGCDKARAYWAVVDNATEVERKQIEKQRKANEQSAEINRLLSKSGLTDRYPGCRFDTWVADNEYRDKALKNAQYYVEHFAEYRSKGSGLYIIGDNERGKTHLAAGIAYELVQRMVPVVMTSMSDLLSRMRSSYNDGYESEQKLMAIMTQVDLLVIDDLGKESPSEWALEKMFQLIDARVTKKLPMIITTNYTDDELLRRLAAEDGYRNYKNDPKTAKAIIARLHRACINMKAGWQKWEGKTA